MDVGEGGGEGGAWIARDGVEFALGPVHDNEDAVNVTVDIGEELGEFDGETFERFAERVELVDDYRSGCHVGVADGFAQVPDCDSCFLKVANLPNAIFTVVDQRFKGAGQPGDFDKVRRRRQARGVSQNA